MGFFGTSEPKNYTFDTFWPVGQSNRFAHAAAFCCFRVPAQAYNPSLFMAIQAQSQKPTYAIGHYATSFPKLTRAVRKSEEFTNDFINSIRDDEGINLSNRFI